MVLGFKFQVSDGFRKNKTTKTKTTFLKTIAITIAIAMSKGSGWKPALSVTGDEVLPFIHIFHDSIHFAALLQFV